MSISNKSLIRLVILIVLILTWGSGIWFFVLDQWFTQEGDFGIEKHPTQFLVLKIHAAVAFLIIISFGYFLSDHVRYSWKRKPKRKLGIVLLIVNITLIITAYLLYYVGNDNIRINTSYIHTAIGFVYPIILAAHINFEIKHKKQQRILRAQ